LVAHEKRNPAQLFCAVPTQNDLALSSLLFSDHPTQKLEYPTATPQTRVRSRSLPATGAGAVRTTSGISTACRRAILLR